MDVLQKPVLQREDVQPAHLAMYNTYEALQSYIHRVHSFLAGMVLVSNQLIIGTSSWGGLSSSVLVHALRCMYPIPSYTSPLFEALPPTL